jgi:glycerophosphoryl diester phosphodiesterase
MKKIIHSDHWLRARPIAHRGLHDISKGIPENSLKAFEQACLNNFPIELDVRITLDGKAAVFHDMNLSRLTGNNKWISRLSSNVIKNFRLLNTNEHIPLLEDVLKLVNGRVPVLIEIKRNLLPGILEDAVMNVLKDYKGEFAILSFNPVALRYIHEREPEYLSGINIGRLEKFLFKTNIFNKFIYNLSKPHFISYSINGKMPMNSVSFFRKMDLPILAWTVDSEQDEKYAREFADNIIFEKYVPI